MNTRAHGHVHSHPHTHIHIWHASWLCQLFEHAFLDHHGVEFTWYHKVTSIVSGALFIGPESLGIVMVRLFWLYAEWGCVLLAHLIWLWYNPVTAFPWKKHKCVFLNNTVQGRPHIGHMCKPPPLSVQDWWIQNGSASAPPYATYASCHVLSPCSVRGWQWDEASILSRRTLSHAQLIPGEYIICYTPKD